MHNSPPIYLPFLQHPQIVSMGLAKLDPGCWVEPDNSFLRYQQNKLDLYDSVPDRVHAALPVAEAAERELGRRLLAHLVDDHDAHYQRDRAPDRCERLILPGYGLAWPLDIERLNIWETGLWVQDDLCLLQEVDGRYLLTAASLCAPSGWALQEKIGKPMHEIHAPVPGLNKTIGKQIDHVLAKLSPLRPFQRFNWSIKTTGTLALFPGDQALEGVVEKSELFLRVERQTLTRLPTSQAIAFTIRVYTYPLETLAGIAGAPAALQKAVYAMSADEAKYKSMLTLFPRLKAFFRSQR